MDLDRYGTRHDVEALLTIRDRLDDLVLSDLPSEPLGPRADLLDLGDAWQLRMEVPGVRQSDLELALQGDELVVAGVRETLEDGVRAVFTERPTGPFQRAIRIPGPVDVHHVSGHLREGLLLVHLPKLVD